MFGWGRAVNFVASNRSLKQLDDAPEKLRQGCFVIRVCLLSDTTDDLAAMAYERTES